MLTKSNRVRRVRTSHTLLAATTDQPAAARSKLTTTVSNLGQSVKPTSKYAYYDRLIVWFRERLTREEILHFKSLCRSFVLYQNGQQIRKASVNFGLQAALYPDSSFKQSMWVYQPTLAALEWICARAESRLTYVEFALDWVFDDDDARNEAIQFLRAYHVKKYRRNQEVKFSRETRYSDKRGAPNNFVCYPDKPSRITGEVYCVHLEWRITHAATLLRAGIHSVTDLLSLDHRKFWTTRLLCSGLDVERLGRLVNNKGKSARRHPWIREYGANIRMNMDRRTGGIIKRALATNETRNGSTQSVIDAHRKHVAVRRCLIPIDVTHLLPDSRSSL
jgi:hypothetical protein